MAVAKQSGRLLTKFAASLTAESGVRLLNSPVLRRRAMRSIEKQLIKDYQQTNLDEKAVPGFERDRLMMSLALLGTGERAISPCVFVPYAPVNINKIYADGGTLNDAWNAPFFGGIRAWQKDYMDKHGNVLAPCPYRDHHNELQQIVREYEPEPIDGGSLAALTDPEFAQGLTAYGQQVMNLTNEIWDKGYLQVGNSRDLARHPSEEFVAARSN